MDAPNLVKFQGVRQIKDTYNGTFQRKLHFTKDLVSRLSLQHELEGHTGCVNCLQWNEAGDLLASGSDDLNIIIWTPFFRKMSHSYQSGHQGNIFSVKFVPGTNDHCIVSGAADFKIRVHNYITNEDTFFCRCHGGRVKRLATVPHIQQVFWSASEDGTVRQYDLRSPHQCSNVCSNILLNLKTQIAGRIPEVKCIAINPVNTDLLAIGANDPFVRMYDRRFIKPTAAVFSRNFPDPLSDNPEAYDPCGDNLPSDCVTYFVAGHLPRKRIDPKRRNRYRTLTATYVTFSPDGKDLLANLGGEQIYLFNIQSKRKQLVFNMSEKALSLNTNPKDNAEELKIPCCDGYRLSRRNSNGLSSNVVTHSEICDHTDIRHPVPQAQKKRSVNSLPQAISTLKACGSQALEVKDYNMAITIYNEAIVRCPDSASLYYNRSAAYMMRGWDGDYYAAMRDCYSAVDLDQDDVKAHYRLIQCLYKLGWMRETYDCIQAFKIKFPKLPPYYMLKSLEEVENHVKMNMFAEVSESTKASSSKQKPSNSRDEEYFSSIKGKKVKGFSNLLDEEDSEDEESDEADESGTHDEEYTWSDHDIITQTIAAVLPPSMSDKEKSWRASAYDYEYRYCGHCNTTTDIKEANFLGSSGDFIVAGSDDASIFIWDRVTTNIVRVLKGDESIVNCLQPHPSTCVLATSGIDPVVRVWSPRPEDGSVDEREILDQEDAAFQNQRRMNADPLEIMLLNMGFRLPGLLEQLSEDSDSQSGSDRNAIQCATS